MIVPSRIGWARQAHAWSVNTSTATYTWIDLAQCSNRSGRGNWWARRVLRNGQSRELPTHPRRSFVYSGGGNDSLGEEHVNPAGSHRPAGQPEKAPSKSNPQNGRRGDPSVVPRGLYALVSASSERRQHHRVQRGNHY